MTYDPYQLTLLNTNTPQRFDDKRFADEKLTLKTNSKNATWRCGSFSSFSSNSIALNKSSKSRSSDASSSLGVSYCWGIKKQNNLTFQKLQPKSNENVFRTKKKIKLSIFNPESNDEMWYMGHGEASWVAPRNLFEPGIHAGNCCFSELLLLLLLDNSSNQFHLELHHELKIFMRPDQIQDVDLVTKGFSVEEKLEAKFQI